MDTVPPSAPPPEDLLDYSGSLGSFLVWSPKGQLFALDHFFVSPDFTRVVPKVDDANFGVLYPMITSMNPSNIMLVVHPTGKAQAYFLMEIKAGDKTRTVKVFQDAQEIIANALNDNRFPVVHFGELQKGLVISRQNKTPLTVRIRFLEIREGISDAIRRVVRDLFLANAETEGDKSRRLESLLEMLKHELSRIMVEDFLTKCVWLDPKTGHLGKMASNSEKTGFSNFVTGDPQINNFSKSLETKPDGSFAARKDFANVLPLLVRNLPWTCPTLHIYDENIRERYKLDEYYSLYEGLKALCPFGAPVLVNRGFDAETAIPVYLLRPAGKGGDFTEFSIREFPTRHVVWDKTRFS